MNDNAAMLLCGRGGKYRCCLGVFALSSERREMIALSPRYTCVDTVALALRGLLLAKIFEILPFASNLLVLKNNL